MQKIMLEPIGVKTAVALIGKCFLWLAVVFGWEPAFDFVILQVDSYAILSPYMKEFLGDIKIISGVLVGMLVAIKLFMGLLKPKNKK